MSLLPNKITLNEYNENRAVIKAASFINRGYAIIFPTDTIYGIGVDAYNEKAVDRFFKLKKRSLNKPVSVFVRDIQMIDDIAYINHKQKKVLESFLPGPYTFVLRSKDKVQKKLCARTETIGVRIPKHPFCNKLTKELNVPITASSANISGMEQPINVEEIITQFKENSILPDMIIDAGSLKNKSPSTVIDITTNRPRILRMSSMNSDILKKLTYILDEAESILE